MKLSVMLTCLVLGALAGAAIQSAFAEVSAGTGSVARTLDSGLLSEADNGDFTQDVILKYEGVARRIRRFQCQASGVVMLDGVIVGSPPTALSTFCSALVTPTTGFGARRNQMLSAAGVQTLLLSP